MSKSRSSLVISSISIACLIFSGVPRQGLAQCDVIPSAEREFRSAQGTIDLPFSLPGEVAERITIGLDRITPSTPNACHSSPGFVNLPGGSSLEDDYFITILFKAPSGTTSAVIVTTAAQEAACLALESACDAQLTGSATCRVASGAPGSFEITSQELVSVRLPDTDDLVGGPNDDLTLTGPALLAVTPSASALPCDLTAFTCAECLANPGTCGSASQLVACVDEFYAQNGTCDVGSTAAFDAPFRQLTVLPPANDFGALCSVDPETPCTGTIDQLRFTVDSDGNALVPTDWRGVLVQSERIPIPRLVSGTTDFNAFAGGAQCVGGAQEGNTCVTSATCLPGGTCIDAVFVPNESLLSSFSLGGHRLPPIFTPLVDPNSTSVGNLSLFGSVDAPVGVMRIARRSPDYLACTGGSNAGLPCSIGIDCPGSTCDPTTCRGGVNDGLVCTGDDDCTGGECGPSIFDFSTRLSTGIGPVVIDGTIDQLELTAANPVPLDGLFSSNDVFAFVVSEGIDNSSLNDDSDTSDAVVRMRDRTTGDVLPIGTTATDGRAVSRIRQAQFSYPAIAVEGPIVAFLEPEPLEGDCSAPAVCDKNADGDLQDTILRVYEAVDDCGGAGPCAEDLIGALPPIAIDAAPRINSRSVVISGGLVYYRRPEWAGMPHKTSLVSIASDGTQSVPHLIFPIGTDDPSISDDGRFVAFESKSPNLDPADSGSTSDIFLHDRDLDGNGIFDEILVMGNPGIDTSRVNSDISVGRGDAIGAAMSADAMVVAYEQRANGDTIADVWVRDYFAMTTERASISTGAMGVEGDAPSRNPDISATGQFVSFASDSMNLVVGDTNLLGDVFVRDRGALTTSRVSLTESGGEAQPSRVDEVAPISDAGDRVAFSSDASDLVAGELDATSDVFVRDSAAPDTIRVSESATGEQADDVSESPAISGDGRFVAFVSLASTLVAGDTNGLSDVFVKDLDSGLIERVSIASNGMQGSRATSGGPPSISRDGRYVAFASSAREFSDEMQSGTGDIFVHDRLTGITSLTSVLQTACNTGTAIGAEDCCAFPLPPNPQTPLCTTTSNSINPAISADGRFVSYMSNADLHILDVMPGVRGDLNEEPDILVRGPDTTDSIAFAANNFSQDDAELDDVVLQVIDTSSPSPSPFTLGNAGDVEVIDGSAAFLDSLSGTGRVHLSFGGSTAQDLGRDATAIAFSTSILAALVPDGFGALEVQIYDWTALTPSWTDLGFDAFDVDVAGTTVAALAAADSSIQIFDASAPTPDPLLVAPPHAEDFVVGERAVAFRTSEAVEAVDLNGDGDQTDFVLQVFDLTSGMLFNTEQAAIRCPLEACDPRTPYSVEGGIVTFLTLEPEQGSTDLDGDGDADDLVKQTFNVDEAVASAAIAAMFGETLNGSACVTPIANAGLGVCSNTGLACRSNSNCLDPQTLIEGECYVPPGRCLLEEAPQTMCDPSDSMACGGPGTSTFCFSEDGIDGFCHEDRGACTFDASCADAGAFCVNSNSDVHRLASPIAGSAESGAQALVSVGACFESLALACVTDVDCVSGVCGDDGFCRRRHGSCRDDADCETGMTCDAHLIIVGAADSDGDGVLDPFDSQPLVPNADQIACPEPDTSLLLVWGTLALGVLGRRRSRGVTT